MNGLINMQKKGGGERRSVWVNTGERRQLKMFYEQKEMHVEIQGDAENIILSIMQALRYLFHGRKEGHCSSSFTFRRQFI
jgi:hypothetical protein